MRRLGAGAILLAGCSLLVDPTPPARQAGLCGNGVVDPPRVTWEPGAVAVAEPVALAVAALGGDARPDLVVASRGGEVRELRNVDGALVAQPPVAIPNGRLAAVAAGPLDGQGVDLLVIDAAEPGSWRALGGADGGFATPQRMAALPTGAPSAVVIGDFDGDQDLDGVVAGQESGSFLPNDGRGFLRAVVLDAPFAPTALAAGDVDGDGRPDVAAVSRATSRVVVLHGGVAGASVPFSPGETIDVPAGPVAIAAAQLDGASGGLDLVTVSDGSMAILLAAGDRVHRPAEAVPLAAAPTALATGDLDGDGDIDLLVALAGGTLTSWINDGEAGFTHAGDHALGADAAALAAADLDGDGRAELVAALPATGAVAVLAATVQGEDCDDGNVADGDGCPADCRR